MGSFQCTRCGSCCKSLLNDENGNLFGMYLDPSEIDKFPKEVVFPLFGIGDPIQITAYQVGVNLCPNYDESGGLGRCKIYDSRPLMCKAYPVISMTRVSPLCPGVQRITDGVNRDSLKAELAAHSQKIEQMVSRPPHEWVWPLNKRQWIHIKEVSK